MATRYILCNFMWQKNYLSIATYFRSVEYIYEYDGYLSLVSFHALLINFLVCAVLRYGRDCLVEGNELSKVATATISYAETNVAYSHLR